MLGLADGALIVGIMRLIVPVFILRWPLAGSIAAVIADGIDVFFLSFLGGFSDYQAADKLLDFYAMTFMAIAALRWKPLEKWPLLGLFFFRGIGVVLFEMTGLRWLLLVFPNLFLFYYFFCAARNRFFPSFILTIKRVAIILLILLIPILIEEYLLHIMDWPWTWLGKYLKG